MADEFGVIVEDAATNSDLVRGLLSPQGLDVRTGNSAEEALRVFEELKPRLVLTDIGMSGADGFELIKRLKSDPAKRDITVLALGDFAGNDGAQKALSAGFDGSVAKPIDPSTFLALIQKYLAQPPESLTGPAASA